MTRPRTNPLAELGGSGQVEREMVRELAATRVLRNPDRVPEAHAVAMRALEVRSPAPSSCLVAASSWVILQGAAIARRRIKLTLDRPLAALWETIGWCGRPPRDTSSLMAAIAIALTVAGWLLIPLGLLLVFALF